MGANSDASPALKAIPSTHRPLLPAQPRPPSSLPAKPKQHPLILKPLTYDIAALPLPPHAVPNDLHTSTDSGNFPSICTNFPTQALRRYTRNLKPNPRFALNSHRNSYVFVRNIT